MVCVHRTAAAQCRVNKEHEAEGVVLAGGFGDPGVQFRIAGWEHARDFFDGCPAPGSLIHDLGYFRCHLAAAPKLPSSAEEVWKRGDGVVLLKSLICWTVDQHHP